MIEIERKFLILSHEFENQAEQKFRIAQAYLNSDPARTVRIRIRGDQGFLTVKGPSEEGGLERFEWEQEIPVKEAEALLALCEPGIIEKIRYLVRVGKHVFEVDKFLGENDGLILAEVELATASESYMRPDWLGKEVTGDSRYYNSYLKQNPYKNWPK